MTYRFDYKINILTVFENFKSWSSFVTEKQIKIIYYDLYTNILTFVTYRVAVRPKKRGIQVFLFAFSVENMHGRYLDLSVNVSKYVFRLFILLILI